LVYDFLMVAKSLVLLKVDKLAVMKVAVKAEKLVVVLVATLVVIWEMKLAPRVGGRMTGLQYRWVQQN
jgi:hypothetical protein